MGNFKGIIVGSLIARLLLFVGDWTLAVDSKEAAPSGKLENRARAGEKLEQHDRFKAEEKALRERLAPFYLSPTSSGLPQRSSQRAVKPAVGGKGQLWQYSR